jgi:L-lactate dehydrogenase complex protein LldE
MADDKITDAQNTGADIIASADLGCLLHLEGRIARRGLPIRTMHIAEILAGDDDAQH